MSVAPKAVHESTRRAFSVSVYGRNAGAVLLAFHRRLGTWLPVGGEIEPGETPLEAATREIAWMTARDPRIILPNVSILVDRALRLDD